MGFEEDCRAILAYLPEEFGQGALDRWIPWLEGRHPDLMNIPRKLHDQLELFEARGLIQPVGENSWAKQGPLKEPEMLDLGLPAGVETSRDQLAEILGMEGTAALQRGMFKPASGPFQDQLLLFHDPFNNPYGDEVGSEVIHYVGQGQEGDQKLSSFNRYLAEHLKQGYTVHFFEKADRSGTLNYRGEVVCDDVERVYRPDEGRSVLVFKLVEAEPLEPETHWEPVRYYEEAQREIETFEGPPRFVEREQRTSAARRLVRDTAFRDQVLEAYERRCAVCGVPLTIDDLTELEAAHIVGVAEQGPDELRNGLCLCVRHHWAFDNGVFTLNDELEVLSFLDDPDPHGELADGAEIHAPERQTKRPHQWYVEYHREKWEKAMG